MERAEVNRTTMRNDLPPIEDLAMGHHKILDFGGEIEPLAAQIEVGDMHQDGCMPGVIVRLSHPEGGRFALLSAEGARVMIQSLQSCLERVEQAAKAQVDARLAAIGKGAA